jgi:hypothetical protein
VHDVDLAWALAEATHDRLDAAERIYAYVALGGGDTAIAIRGLTLVAMRERVLMSPELADAVRTWWAAHEGGRDEFRDLVVALREHGDDPSAPAARQPAYLPLKRQFSRNRLGAAHISDSFVPDRRCAAPH